MGRIGVQKQKLLHVLSGFSSKRRSEGPALNGSVAGAESCQQKKNDCETMVGGFMYFVNVIVIIVLWFITVKLKFLKNENSVITKV